MEYGAKLESGKKWERIEGERERGETYPSPSLFLSTHISLRGSLDATG